MANFDKAFIKTLQWEGGYINDPNDPGGETKYGISKRSFPWVDIENLTVQEAKEIYYLHYWCKIQGMQIEDQKMAESLFDASVNLGIKTAVKIAQNITGAYPDGIVGHKTLQSFREIGARYFIKCFAIDRMSHYIDLCRKNPDLKKYIFGWARRTVNFA